MEIINISKIIKLGDLAERRFFMFLGNNSIYWKLSGYNMDEIKVMSSCIEKIKDVYPEVEIV